jgi:hypothetical protein
MLVSPQGKDVTDDIHGNAQDCITAHQRKFHARASVKLRKAESDTWHGRVETSATNGQKGVANSCAPLRSRCKQDVMP